MKHLNIGDYWKGLQFVRDRNVNLVTHPLKAKLREQEEQLIEAGNELNDRQLV
jgi:hypothetical protein